jgi:Protein of unknown function (DUF3489)
MSTILTDTQIVLLNVAAQREDRCLEAPKNLKGKTAEKTAVKLAEAGLVREILSKAAMPVWRRDEEAARSYSLKLTAAGVKAARAESNVELSTDVAGAELGVTKTETIPDTTAEMPASAAMLAASPDLAVTSATAPRGGTKIAKVIGLLQRGEGATLDEVVTATGWLPHTTRAAFTGLRKRGYAIERRLNAKGAKAYLIATTPQAQSA